MLLLLLACAEKPTDSADPADACPVAAIDTTALTFADVAPGRPAGDLDLDGDEEIMGAIPYSSEGGERVGRAFVYEP